MGRLTAQERGSIALANLAIFFSAYMAYLFYLMAGTISDSLPAGSLQAQQGQQLTQLVNAGGSAIGLGSVTVTVIGAGVIILAVFILMQFSTGRYKEVYE